jgi:hypothetical protein
MYSYYMYIRYVRTPVPVPAHKCSLHPHSTIIGILDCDIGSLPTKIEGVAVGKEVGRGKVNAGKI